MLKKNLIWLLTLTEREKTLTKEQFDKIEKRSGSKIQLCFELFCSEKSAIPYQQFEHIFEIWIRMFRGGDVDSAIEYYKNKFVK